MTNHSELTEMAQEEMERVRGGDGAPTEKLYVATNVGVFVDADCLGRLLITTDAGVY